MGRTTGTTAVAPPPGRPGVAGARLGRPVISVGNLALGGRGKTPLVAYLARFLAAQGERPAILTRGYHRRRREDGVVIVRDAQAIRATLEESGDEPMMLAESLPGVSVLVSEIRALAGALAERALGATVHILDDGFQHRALSRDVDLVVVAAEDFRDRRVPFGRLRERPSALGRADAVLADGPVPAFPVEAGRVPATFELRRALEAPTPLVGPAIAIDRAAPVAAVAGIARPERFQALLEAQGWRVARLLAFPDHHPYTVRDVEEITRSVRETGVGLTLTTAKDAVRLRAFGTVPIPMAVVPLTVTVEPAERFQAWLLDALRSAREHSA